MEREKMSEKIARIICENKVDDCLCPEPQNIACTAHCKAVDVLKTILPDGAVVLEKEEYERLKKEELYAQGKYNLCHGNRIAETTEQIGQMLIDYDLRIRKAYDEIIPKLLEENKQAHKEMAKRIFERIHEKEGYYPMASIGISQNDMIEIAKIFGIKYTPEGVEVEE